MPSEKPVFATHWDPRSGPARVRVWGRGKKPGHLLVGDSKNQYEVRADAVKFQFGPDAKKFGLPYKDPYAGIDRNDDLRTEAVSLKSIAKLLREAEDEPKKEEGEDSVDAQIDKYLSQYESQAKEEGKSKIESVSYDRMTWDWRKLTEAEDEKTDEKAEEPEKTKLEDINMRSFVSDVMRLVENYDSLLEIKNAVLRRAANYLSTNYEGDALQAFENELLESYGIEIGQTESEKSDEIQPPKAAAAGPMSGGGGAS